MCGLACGIKQYKALSFNFSIKIYLDPEKVIHEISSLKMNKQAQKGKESRAEKQYTKLDARSVPVWTDNADLALAQTEQ